MRSFLTILIALLFLSLFQSGANAQAIGDVVSRAQTNLNRVAVGLPPLAPRHATNVDRLVDVFSALLSDSAADNDRALRMMDEIEAQASVALRRFGAAYRWKIDNLYARYHAIDAALSLEPAMRGDDARWIRFVAISYKAIDALSKGARSFSAASLKIPCATASRLRSLTLESSELGAFIGELTDCPMRKDDHAPIVLVGAQHLDAYLDAARPHRYDGADSERTVPDVSPGTSEWARRHMGDRADEAEAILRREGDIRSRIDYGLFLYYYRAASIERDEAIRRSFSAAIDLALRGASESYRKGFDLRFIRANMDQLVGLMLEQPAALGYAIPCSIVFRDPKILVHTEPRYGGSGDAFMPDSGCDPSSPEMAGYPFAQVDRFRRLAQSAGKYGTEGTIWTAIYVGHSVWQYRLQSDPRAFLVDLQTAGHPYEVWAYLSIANRAAFRTIDAAYEEAFKGLLPFYRKLGLTEAQAAVAARNGLAAIVLGPNCGDSPPPQSFRKMLLDRAPLAELRAYAEGDEWRDGDRLQPFSACAHFAGIEPLAHLAILDLDAFAFLRGLAEKLNPQDTERLDLQLEIDARSAFGKTPLMTAVQHRMTDAAAWLMANGAEVNAVTDSRTLVFGRRTPLMYAAASGSLDMIRALLRAGGDPLQADTMGRRALHYLLGAGPRGEPPNPALSEAEILAAYELLR